MYREYDYIIESVNILKCFNNYSAVCDMLHCLYPFYSMKSEFIMLKGEIASQVYVCRSGLLYYGLQETGSDPRKNHINFTCMGEIPIGEFFGRDALNVNDSIYSYSVLSDERSELLFADNAEILPIIKSNSYFEKNTFLTESEIINKIQKIVRINEGQIKVAAPYQKQKTYMMQGESRPRSDSSGSARSISSSRRSILEESTWRLFVQRHYVIYPFHPAKLAWDFFIALIILYNIIEIPLTIAYDINIEGFLYYFDLYVVNIIFVFDIILSFNTALTSSSGQDYNRKHIAKSYMKFWFWIDVLSVIPFDEIFSSLTNTNGVKATKLIKFIRLIRLIRLVRLLKLDQILGRYDIDVNPTILDLVKQIFIMMFIAHLVGCLWYGVSSFKVGDGWINSYCVYDDDLNCTALINSDLGTQYITSIYFSFTLYIFYII